MKNSRQKGADGERELAGLIHDQLGVRMVRNLEQSRSGGHDLVVHPDSDGSVADRLRDFAVEVKRHRRATQALLATWWGQTVEQAVAVHGIPALAYREDRQDWLVIIPMTAMHPDMPAAPGLNWTTTLRLPGWCAFVRETAR